MDLLLTDTSCLSQVYGMLMAKSTYEGMSLANKQKRPFVLTRAGFVGSQRYAATWTGDNLSTWEHLHMSIPMVLQLVSGNNIFLQHFNGMYCSFRHWPS